MLIDLDESEKKKKLEQLFEDEAVRIINTARK